MRKRPRPSVSVTKRVTLSGKKFNYQFTWPRKLSGTDWTAGDMLHIRQVSQYKNEVMMK